MQIKTGYVAILGKPNAGKSTLLNAILGERLSIVTNKPQTTRKRILGILNRDNCQIIFLDTPGILDPSYPLQERMMGFVERSVKDADVILLLVDLENDRNASDTINAEIVRSVLSIKNVKKILVINKADLIDQPEIKKIMDNLQSLKMYDDVIPVSALYDFNLNNLLEKIIGYLPEGPKLYPDEQLTDETERFFVSEIIREKIFEFFRDEIPYSTEVVIDDFKERENGKDYISASIVVEKDSQKPIIIGKGGESIKKIGKNARTAIEKFLDREVFLDLNVKIKKKWRSDPAMLKSFGYQIGDEY